MVSDRLLHDQTWPFRIKPLGPEAAERVVALTDWGVDGESGGWRAHRLRPERVRHFKLSNDPALCRQNGEMSWVSMSIRPQTLSSSWSTKRAGFRRSAAPSRDCR
jgi:hypothetical protein